MIPCVHPDASDVTAKLRSKGSSNLILSGNDARGATHPPLVFKRGICRYDDSEVYAQTVASNLRAGLIEVAETEDDD